MHDQLGRALTDSEQAALHLVLQTTEGPVRGLLFTDDVHDFQCFGPLPNYCDPQYAECHTFVDAYGWAARVAEQLDDSTLVALGAAGGSSEGPYVFQWGAVAPEVSRVSVVIGNGELRNSGDAVIANGYFMTVLQTDPCCLTEYTAYDASGAVVAEYHRTP